MVAIPYLEMFVVSFIFLVLIVIAAARAIQYEVKRADRVCTHFKTIYQDEYVRKYDIDKERKELEEKGAEIFALYDITKEITKSFSVNDALMAFRSKLKEHIHYEECRLLDPLSEEVQTLSDDSEYLLFVLRGKTRLLGYLAIKGVLNRDKEKATILAHQFTLALQRIRLYQEVERLAMTDSLTELFTRRYILDRFEEELSRAKARKISLSFLMVDVDHFKRFNDQYGHLTGDQVLRGIARTLRDNIREIDIAGRLGGEEFCVVLPDTNREGAAYVAERIRSGVEKTKITAYDTVARATVSIGASTFPEDGRLTAELLDKADWALYRAKKNGRNSICSYGVY